MSAPQNVIAMIFDFDDTLTDDSTTKLLETHGIDPKDFWGKQMPGLTADGWDPPLAYLNLLLQNVGEGRPLGMLTNKKLREFGATLEFYPGLPQLFVELEQITQEHTLSRPAIEFYIISGGLEEIIRGSSIANCMTGIRGCNFAEANGVISAVKNSITFTEKTRYIFEINKGLTDGRKNPYDVNNFVAEENRRIPISNMIYIGDGLTDVPCFSLLTKSKGQAFGVFDPRREGAPKKAWELLVAPKRVQTMNSPKYNSTDDLGSLLRAVVKKICIGMDVRTRSA